MSKLTEGLSKDEVKLLNNMYLRSGNYAIAWCYSRMLGTSVAWILYPYINWLYKDDPNKDRKIEALEREATGYINITPQIAPLCYSIFAAMEKEAKENEDFDVSTIDAVKASIQGPLSGIGDSIFWVTWRVIVTGIALTFTAKGSILGPIIFALLFNIPGYVLRYYLTFVGYKLGTSFISKMYESGLIQLVTKAAATIGLIMIGGMALVDVFNGILPGLLELALIMVILKLIEKKTNILFIILGIFVVGIVGAWVGIF